MFKLPPQSPAGLVMGVVLAATPTEDKAPSRDMTLDQLSLYSAPQRNLRYVEPSVGVLEQGVTSARHASQPALTWTQLPPQSPAGLVMGVVLAATPTEDKAPSRDMTLDQLSLYSAPQRNLRYVEPSVGVLEQGVTSARHASQPALTWTQGVYSGLKPRVDKAVQTGKDGYVYLQNPPPEFYPRAGVIGFAGILGLFLARGSRVKRLVYPSVLTAVAASMYYPQEAAQIAKATGDSIYDWAIRAYVTVEGQLFKPNAPKPQADKSSSEETKA